MVGGCQFGRLHVTGHRWLAAPEAFQNSPQAPLQPVAAARSSWWDTRGCTKRWPAARYAGKPGQGLRFAQASCGKGLEDFLA